MTSARDDANVVHIVCPVYNGARWLREFVESVQRQTASRWMLWLRDDGSHDDSVEMIAELAGSDGRVRVVHDRDAHVGVVGAFRRLIDAVPVDAPYLMLADQDDVWLPAKVERTLAAMQRAERDGAGPVLVHTDMAVVGVALEPIAHSFWSFAHIDPMQVAVTRLVVRNVVTGATTMINRALRELASPVPDAAAMHDWWLALVASAFGRIIAVAEPTMLYRQHDNNAVGARTPGATFALSTTFARAAVAAVGKTERLRRDIAGAARQAGAFAERYGHRLASDDRDFLRKYASIPTRPAMQRKLAVLQLHLHRQNGWLRNVGLLLRA